MGRKSLGTSLELRMVKKAFKNGGWGFRAPGSGTFVSHDDVYRREGIQAECTIKLSVAHLDLGFKIDYLTADYVSYLPEWGEVRVVEAKTVRARKGRDPKTTTMTAYYYLTEEVSKDTIGRGEKRRDNPLKGKTRKSDFCMELERTWMLARVMEKSGAFPTVPVRPYLQVRFIKSGKEAFFHVPDLIESRELNQDVLKVIKDENGNVYHEWQERTKKT